MKTVAPRQLKTMLEGEAGRAFALIDVRGHGEFRRGHILGATSLPRRMIEFRMRELVSFSGTPIVLCDEDGRRASLAAKTLERMRYSDVAVLEGGLSKWVESGYNTELEMNTLSKIFGEKVFSEWRVPEVTAQELNEKLRRGEDVTIIDVRTHEEHRVSCIPGAINIPGGELALRISEAVTDPSRPIVVHCAGRTRSIIAAATLQKLGFQNAFALKNGTMGWELAGLELQHGAKTSVASPSHVSISESEVLVSGMAGSQGIQRLSIEDLKDVQSRRDGENVYLIDVRTREEYISGHMPGFQWFPGGQAVQQADELIAVPDGKIIFACDGRIRSTFAAYWFRELGYPHVYTVDGGVKAWTVRGLHVEVGMQGLVPFGLEDARARVKLLSPIKFNLAVEEDKLTLIFVGTSQNFADGHIPNSHWLPRDWLELRVSGLIPSNHTPIGVTCSDGLSSPLAAVTLMDLGYESVKVLEGGVEAWRNVGLPTSQGSGELDGTVDDVLPFIGTRMSREEMLRYLVWEEKLAERY